MLARCHRQKFHIYKSHNPRMTQYIQEQEPAEIAEQNASTATLALRPTACRNENFHFSKSIKDIVINFRE